MLLLPLVAFGFSCCSPHGTAGGGIQDVSPSLKLVQLKPSQSVSHIAFGDPNVFVKAWLGDFSYLGYDWNIGIAVLVIENPGETEMRIPLFHEYWKLLVSHKDSGDLTSHRVIDRGPSNKNPERTWPQYSQRIGPHETLAIVLGVPHAQRLSLGDKILVECRPPGFDWKSNWLEIR